MTGNGKFREDPIWFRFVACGFGDATAACFSHPADVIKVRMQLTGANDPATPRLKIKDFVYAARRSIAIEGFRNGLYPGFSASIARQLSFGSLRHGLCGVLERAWRDLHHEPQTISTFVRIGSAAVAGFTAAAITNPTDVVLVRMQADGNLPKHQRREYRHFFDGISRTFQAEGLAALWRGLGPNAARAVLVTVSQVVTYAETKIALGRAGLADGTSLHLASAITSATVACIVTSPVDVIKTRMMNMQKTHGISYSGPVDCVLQTLRTEGPLAFYKGLSFTFLRLWPHTLVLWMAQEQYLHWMRNRFCT